MARLIVVSGPNGAGKTTLIKSRIETLKQLGYNVIIPDELEDLSDTPISDAVAQSLIKNTNTVFETPLQFDELAQQVQKFRDAGYYVVLIHLFLENADSSVLRVKDRLIKGGRNIPTEEVRFNFEKNYLHIIKHHYLFHQLYFVDASNFKNNVIAEIQQNRIKYYAPLLSIYIRDLLYEIVMKQGGDKVSLAILKNNKVYGSLSFRKMAKVLRIIFYRKK